MTQSRILKIGVIVLFCLLLAYACSSLFKSSSPAERTQKSIEIAFSSVEDDSVEDSPISEENLVVEVPLSSLSETEAVEVDWNGHKVLVVKSPEVNAFVLPYKRNAYRLPDPTWNQALVPCKTISKSDNVFACTDAEVHPNWREAAQWDFSGNTINENWVPNLPQAPFTISDANIVISEEYR